jgi:hypothetical protein
MPQGLVLLPSSFQHLQTPWIQTAERIPIKPEGYNSRNSRALRTEVETANMQNRLCVRWFCGFAWHKTYSSCDGRIRGNIVANDSQHAGTLIIMPVTGHFSQQLYDHDNLVLPANSKEDGSIHKT